MVMMSALQDSFITQLITNQINVSIFLVSGIKLHGIIDSHDSEVIFLKGTVTQAVYKHAISTIVPNRTE
ncbi:MAG: RNA chaperone Hfq [Legionellaceae bacterium]|nr:RNA chaperone Hfq [Legionellaceae bacterium]